MNKDTALSMNNKKPHIAQPIPITHTQRVAILIDANNLERSIRSKYGANSKLNYDKFIAKILKNRGLNNFIYLIEGKGDDISNNFTKMLAQRYFGIIVPCNKSADVPLAMNAAILIDSVDTFILFSGDADYIDCVSILKAHGKRIEIVGVNGYVSLKLQEAVHSCTFIGLQDVFVKK